VITGRFNGPPTSGQGGYSCGVAGRLVGGDTAEVKLRRPPLETPLDVVRIEDAVRLLRRAGRSLGAIWATCSTSSARS
jgi:hypothetical protein